MTGCRRRRAFALPMVLLVALVASLAIVVLLNRQGSDSLTIKRHADQYIHHHLYSGLSELIQVWMSTQRGSLSASLTAEGKAFRLDMPDRSDLNVYLFDAQGAGLTMTGSLGGRERQIADRAAALLRNLVNTGYAADAKAGGIDAKTGVGVGGGTGELIRSVGPAKVSINAATDPVLRAIAMATIDPERVEAFVNAIIRARERGSLTDKELHDAATEAALTPQETEDAQLMLTAQPTLWRAVCIRTTALGAEIERSTGLILVLPKTGQPYERTIQVLSWESTTAND